MNSQLHRLSSARRHLTVGALAGLLAGLAPVAVQAALPSPTADAPAAPAPVAAPTPTVAVAAAPAAPVPVQAAPAPASSSLNNLLDRSPYSGNYTLPAAPAALAIRTPVAPANIQYHGYSREGDQVFVSVYDVRSQRSQQLALGETWNIPNGGQITVNSLDDAGKSISVNTSGRDVNVPLQTPALQPMAVASSTPNIYLSNGPVSGGPGGGRRGGQGGIVGPAGGPAAGPGGFAAGPGGGGGNFAGQNASGGGRRGGAGNGGGGAGNGGGGAGNGGGFNGNGGGAGNGGGGRGNGGGGNFAGAGNGAAAGGGFNTGNNGAVTNTSFNTVNTGGGAGNGGAATRRNIVQPAGA